MKVFTYGIEESMLNAIRWKFGKAEYLDVTVQYQDILALCADIVIMAIEHTSDEVLHIIKQYEKEVGADEDRKYYYLSDNDICGWFMEYLTELEDTFDGVAQSISEEDTSIVENKKKNYY